MARDNVPAMVGLGYRDSHLRQVVVTSAKRTEHKELSSAMPALNVDRIRIILVQCPQRTNMLNSPGCVGELGLDALCSTKI